MEACVISRSSRHLPSPRCASQLARALAQRLAVLDQLHVAVHLLELPAEGVRNEGNCGTRKPISLKNIII
jgi:hypothetical protein